MRSPRKQRAPRKSAIFLHTFDSCEEIEIMSKELNVSRINSIGRFIQRRLENKNRCQEQSSTNLEIKKTVIRKEPKIGKYKITKSISAN